MAADDEAFFAGFIDPPWPGASLLEWRTFKADMESIVPRTPAIQEYIDMAAREIARAGR